MTLTLDAQAKGSASNSYATRVEADAYFDGRMHPETWVTATGAQKDLALVAATNRLEQEVYLGQRTEPAQRLRWPRYGVENDRLQYYDADVIPRLMKEACYELALVMLEDGTTDRLLDSGLEPFTQVTVGPLSVTLDQSYAAGTLPQQVSRLLTEFRGGGGGTIRLVRS